MTLTYYDAAMAGVVVGGMAWGAWRGVTWQLASLASLIVGYTVAHQLSAQLAPHFPGDATVSRALAMMAVYAGVSAGIFAGAWMIRATLRRLKFEAFDRHLGMLLGGMEGALLGVVATFFVVSLAPSLREPIFASPAGQVVGAAMDAAGPVLPGEVRDALAPYISDARRAVASGRKILPVVEAAAAAESADTSASTTDDGAVERR